MTTNAKNNTYTTPQSAAAEGEVEHKNPKSNADSPPPPQSEPAPSTPIEGDTQEVELNMAPAFGVEPMTPEELEIPESNRATVITGMWHKHAYIGENKFKYKSLSNWCLNTAIGCMHGCLFCYVPGTSANKQARLLKELEVDDPDARAAQLFFCKFNWGGEVGQAARN